MGTWGEVCLLGNRTDPRIPSFQKCIGAREFSLDFFNPPTEKSTQRPAGGVRHAVSNRCGGRRPPTSGNAGSPEQLRIISN